jgi:hypothetical protein
MEMPTNKILYCGNIGRKCPNKTVDGRCTTCGIMTEFEESKPCEHVVGVTDNQNKFLIKYLYNIHNDTPRVVSIVSKPIDVYPNDLYCAKIDSDCSYLTPGGKCAKVQCLMGRDTSTTCEHQITLDSESELVVRLMQFIHRDKERLNKKIQELQQNQK